MMKFINKTNENLRRRWARNVSAAKRTNERSDAKRRTRHLAKQLPIPSGTPEEFAKAAKAARQFSDAWAQANKQKARKQRQRKTIAAKLHPDRVAKRNKEAARLKRQAAIKRKLKGLL